MQTRKHNLVGSFASGYRISSLYLRMAHSRACVRVAAWRIGVTRFSGSAPESLIAAPTDLRAVDPYVAEEILEGRFALAGRVLETGGMSPFLMDLPSPVFAERLHAFAWLRHIRASRSEEAYNRARMITADWISMHGRRINGVAWNADIAAQRLIAWLSHSPVLLHDADSGFYRRFMKSLALHVRYLGLIAKHAPAGEVRLRVRVALAMASISMPTRASKIARQGRKLDRELERQILSDGGHVSRNPRVLLNLLLDLLPLRQSYINLGHDVPVGLVPAIDRIFPALRFFRHHDGDLALFNGATATLANELASVLRYDETSGQPFKALPDMNYHRLAGDETTVIIDTGCAQSMELSRSAHSGCLSFELSCARNRFLVNSGFPQYAGLDFQQICRSTAAHSTVTLSDTSSCRISKSAMLGPVLIGGVTDVEVRRSTDANGNDIVCASHNGYADNFGYFHERELELNSAGTKIKGRDLLFAKDKSGRANRSSLSAVARFHVHPNIELTQINEEAASMRAADGTAWVFSVPGRRLAIAEDIFLGDASGIRRSQQIEVEFLLPETREIRWIIERRE